MTAPRATPGFVLNATDDGLLSQLDAIDATSASSHPTSGKTSIVDHARHLEYSLSLLNRWLDGEENPWATADWDASWRLGAVDESGWQSVRTGLRDQATRWRDRITKRTEWNEIAAAGSLASAVHTAYHFGAIRQLLAALRPIGSGNS